MTRLLRPLVLLTLLPAASYASSFVQIHGVAPSDQVNYLSAEFSCVVGGKATRLPISRVNDEFCDCDHGQDEPGTAACSHLISAQFHCENGGFFPGKIHTSRIHDGICDCCDGSDEEVDGKSSCPNTCAVAAAKFRKEAEQRLEVVKAGFEKRKATINGEITPYFSGAKDAESATQKELAELQLLRERVTVHKDREELKEKKYRMEVARQKQAQGQEQTSKQQFSDAEEKEAVEALDFEGLDVIRVADDDAPVDSVEDERVSEILNSRRDSVKSLVELPDGTRVSLADYLRMGHNKQAPTKKLCASISPESGILLLTNGYRLHMYRRAPRTAEEMRREDFLGPLFNGGPDGRKKIGLYALRTIGIVISPVRALVEVVLFSPKTLWNVLSSPEIAGSAINKLPDFPYPSRSVWFRQLGGGSVYDGYSSVVWGARVVWDAPVYAYHYLFPKLDGALKLPVAESLRKVLEEIDADIARLEREQKDKREAAQMDYGPDRAYFALKEKCIEKRIEKYDYKFCAFGEIKQDYAKLGKWDGWEVKEPSPDEGTVDHTKMRYSKGQKCYKGPERSVLAKLECGNDEEILDVDEPSTCVYEMTIRTPLACTARELAKAQADVAFWTRAH